MNDCPCGSGRGFGDCCQPYLTGAATPPTAEALMRARYTAHAQIDIDFIERTHDPATRADIDRELTERWARRAEWLGLDIQATEAGQQGDEAGTVEFVVHYRERDERRQYHECAQFKCVDGAWFYVDGKPPEATTIRREAPRIGRNHPCACGSGRKYKKCCGARV